MILPNVPPYAWTFFGILKAGAVVAMGNPDAPAGDLEYLLEYTRASVVVTVPRVVEALQHAGIERSPWLRAVLVTADAETGEDAEAEVSVPAIGGDRAECLARSLATVDVLAHRPHATRRDDLAVWLFTSGSTGKPEAKSTPTATSPTTPSTTRSTPWGTGAGTSASACRGSSSATPRGPTSCSRFAWGRRWGCSPSGPPWPRSPDAIARYRPTILTNVPTMIGKLLEHDASQRAAGHTGPRPPLRALLPLGRRGPPARAPRPLERPLRRRRV